MEFPEEICKLIKEYSMPATRPDWRTCGKINKKLFVTDYNYVYYKKLGIMIYLYPDEELLYENYKRVFNDDMYIEINTYS